MMHKPVARSWRIRVAALAVALCPILVLSGCGLGTSGGFVPSGKLSGALAQTPNMNDATINVGSKNFTEQLILGKMIGIIMKSAGATVNDMTNIPGSNSSRQAMLTGKTDVVWEYTGSAWASYMNEDKPIRNRKKQYEAVRKRDLKQNNLVWLPPSPMNNTYALAMTEKNAKKLGVSKISDLKKLPAEKRTFCLESEFASRNDGFRPMLKRYGMTYAKDVGKKNVKLFDTGAVYSALAGGSCNFGEVFSTDGRIQALHLKVLTDDKQFFPHYNVSAVWRKPVLDQYPQIKKLIEPVAAKLNNKELTSMNRKVDVDGEEPATVANHWLHSKGFLK